MAMSSGPDPHRWLTVSEAAEALNVSPDTIYRLAAAGTIKRRKFGARVLIDPFSVLPEGAPAPPREPVDLMPVITQIDLMIEQMQLLRQQVAAAIGEVSE
jgi:excisionase family DNA binding protein